MVRKYREEETREWLDAHLPAWEWRGGELYRQYRTADWRVTLMTANAIGFLAEAAYHHPQLILNYRSVEIFLKTHDAGAITDKDLKLARRIEETALWPAEGTATFDAPPKDWLK